MNVRSAILWTLAALAGLLVAAGVSLAASSLSSQRIGLSAEPLTAGDSLVARDAARPKATSTPEPRQETPRRKTRRKRTRPNPTATPTAVPTAAPTASAEPGDDHGGGSGRGRGRGGGDDSGGDD